MKRATQSCLGLTMLFLGCREHDQHETVTIIQSTDRIRFYRTLEEAKISLNTKTVKRIIDRTINSKNEIRLNVKACILGFLEVEGAKVRLTLFSNPRLIRNDANGKYYALSERDLHEMQETLSQAGASFATCE